MRKGKYFKSAILVMLIVAMFAFSNDTNEGGVLRPVPVIELSGKVPEEAVGLIEMHRASLRIASYYLLPIIVPSSTFSDARIVEVLYCSASSTESATAIALALPKTSVTERTTSMVDTLCTSSLAEIAMRFKSVHAQNDPWIAALRLELKWENWQLKVYVKEAKRYSTMNIEATDLISENPIKTFATDDIENIGTNSKLLGTIKFYETGALIILADSSSVSNYAELDTYQFRKTRKEEELFLDLSFNFINEVLSEQPPSNSLQVAGGQTVDVSVIAAHPDADNIHIKCIAKKAGEDVSDIYFNLKNMNGDLFHNTVEIESKEQDCSQMSNMQSRIECGARNAIIRRLAETVESSLQRQTADRPFRPLSDRRRYPISLNGTLFYMRLNTEYVYSDNASFTMALRAYLQKERL